MSVVREGPFAGRTLADLAADLGPRLLGSRVRGPAFPLLIKLIDARERLSVQVHPDDESAARGGGEAKTEMWYVLEADPGARVFAGLRPGAGPDDLRRALATDRFEPLLQSVSTRRGDAVFVPGGRVHAIDAGNLLLEIQQSSNTTYRLYDWGRLGTDGQPRPLHVEDALRVIRWDDPAPVRLAARPLHAAGPNRAFEVARAPHFVLARLQLAAPWTVRGDGGSFHVLFLAEGSVSLEWDGTTGALAAGTTVLVPAALPSVTIRPANGPAEVLVVTVP
jgi:mannose-6-phosphate isomerase